ncbi:MAG: bacillithiol system redox-active protein YtxJ [Bacteroidetes bacterium]|nr:bacillithiol system redox-active protein YtxJ [Bacteroidota bacterium]
MTDIASPDDFRDAVRASDERPVLIFKHSASCMISARANRQIAQLDQPGDPEVFRVVVQEARPLSNAIAAETGIRHETPQGILFRHGQPVWNTSHFSLTARAVRDALASLSD